MTTTALTTTSPPQPVFRELWRLPGVYAPQNDTYLLARALRAEDVTGGTDVLDICTGSGALALLAASMGARVQATDISWRAVATARINAARTGQRIRVRRGDLTEPLGRQRFDLVVSNPPYVPTPGGVRTRGTGIAWDAGGDGREVVDRLCDRSVRVLRPGGVLLMAQSALCGVEATLSRLSRAGMTCRVAERAFIPFGPVMTGRLAWLRAQGLVAADQDTEEVVVVRAERP